MSSVSQFFNTVSVDYDARILQAVPPYREMLDALLSSVFLPKEAPLTILELGCGTGNLSQALAQRFPNALLTLVDLSGEMLAQAKTKLAPYTQQVATLEQNFTALAFPPEQFDLIISSLALHHLQDPDKELVYHRIGQWLKPGGQFRCADQCLGQPVQAHEHSMARWKTWILENGTSEADAQLWIEHINTLDHYAPLVKHFDWLKAAGLSQLDCYWRLLYWTVFGAEK